MNAISADCMLNYSHAMKLYKKILLSVLSAIMFVGVEMTVSANTDIGRYRTKWLREISQYTGMSSVIDTLKDGHYYGTFRWMKYPLNVTVNDGEVSHIGIQLFTKAEREAMPVAPVYDFMERYLLETHLESELKDFDRGYYITDGVIVEKGNLKNLHNVCGDSTLMFTSQFYNGRRYSVSWHRNDTDIFRISFPASYRLLCGYILDEREQSLSRRISYADSTTRKPLSVDRQDLEECDSLLGSYHIRKGDYCVLPIINNDRCYFVNDTIAELLYGSSYPVESLKNLLVTGEIKNRFTAKLRMMRYGGKIEEFSVPLNTLINYFIDKEGCTPYFGLKGLYPEKKLITAICEMVNAANGYEHLMSITFNIDMLTKKEGEIEIRLTPYIPTHDIKNLYKPKNKKT